MDKYQKCLMDTSRSYIAYINDKEKSVIKCFSDGKITIKQDNDITVGGYILYLANKSFECVFAIKDGKESMLKTEHDDVGSSPKSGDQSRFYYSLSFDDKIEGVRIVFKNNLADALIIPIEFIEADKEAYYNKIEKAKREELIKKAQINASAGADLVNIYFQPCCDNYGKTEIELYLAKGRFSQPRGMCVTFFTPQLLGGEIEQLIGKYTIDDKEVMFKSISGLAKRVYGYRVRQFSTSSELLFETDYAFFSIK